MDALTLHEPIFIHGNENFTEANGVTSGSGTESDPYIIENWEIDSSNANGIFIMSTDAYFVIRNCLLYNGWRGYWKNSHHGICLYFVQNGTIENITSYDNYYGIVQESSSNNRLTNCVVYNNRRGINFDKANNNRVTSCNVYNNFFEGIYLYSSSNTSIMDSAFYKNRHGVYLSWNSDNNRITNCSIYNNSLGGAELRFSLSNQIAKCYCCNNSDYGISLYSSSNNTIVNCTISNNECGVYLHASSNNNTICHNQFIDNKEQLRDEASNYCYDNEFVRAEEQKGRLNWLWENRSLIAILIVLSIVVGVAFILRKKKGR